MMNQVWLLHYKESFFNEECDSSVLNTHQYLKYQQLKQSSNFQRAQFYLYCHGALQKLLMQALSQNKPIPFEFEKNGKPFLKDRALYFNLSHSQEVALIALSDFQHIGVDVEWMSSGKDLLSLARRFFSIEEVLYMHQLTAEQQTDYFYTLWVKKEAILKALGLGIGHLEMFKERGNVSEELEVLPVELPQEYQSYKAAVAGKQLKNVELKQWKV